MQKHLSLPKLVIESSAPYLIKLDYYHDYIIIILYDSVIYLYKDGWLKEFSKFII